MYFDWIKEYYELGYYTNEDVAVFVQAGWITPEEYELITGVPYTV
jgi:uncharacterized XkdX family phage protein